MVVNGCCNVKYFKDHSIDLKEKELWSNFHRVTHEMKISNTGRSVKLLSVVVLNKIFKRQFF